MQSWATDFRSPGSRRGGNGPARLLCGQPWPPEESKGSTEFRGLIASLTLRRAQQNGPIRDCCSGPAPTTKTLCGGFDGLHQCNDGCPN